MGKTEHGRRNPADGRRFRTAAQTLLVLTVLVLPACVTLRGPERWRRSLSDTAGVRLDPEVRLSVNRGGMWFARTAMRFSGEHDFSLDGIHHVDVGVYRVLGPREGPEAPRAIGPGDFEGWSPVALVREEDEHVLVLTRGDGDRIHQLLVVVAEPDEWVIVRMKGRLERILEQAMAKAFEEADRPELYEKTREERGLERR